VPVEPKCRDLFVLLYSIKPTSKSLYIYHKYMHPSKRPITVSGILLPRPIHIVVEIHVFLFCLINTDIYITNNTFIYIKTSKFDMKFGFWKVLKIYWYFLCGQICSECPYCRLRRIFSAVRILPLYLIVVHVRANLKICQTTCFFVIVYLKPKRVRKKSGRKHMDRAWSIYCYIKYGVVFVQFHWLNQSRDIQNI
jgi:hypothetical protein